MCYFSSFFLEIKSNIFSFYRLDLHISKKPVAIYKLLQSIKLLNIQYIISFKIDSLWRINAQPSIYLALKLSRSSRTILLINSRLIQKFAWKVCLRLAYSWSNGRNAVSCKVCLLFYGTSCNFDALWQNNELE